MGNIPARVDWRWLGDDTVDMRDTSNRIRACGTEPNELADGMGQRKRIEPRPLLEDGSCNDAEAWDGKGLIELDRGTPFFFFPQRVWYMGSVECRNNTP